MSTYSLLQISLDQTIDRQSLADASVAVKSVARADCAHLQRDLFGIVISDLPLDDAQIFQAELKRRNFLTELVADDELPVLHDEFSIQRIEIEAESLSFADAMGRVQSRAMEELVFVAGGFLNHSKMKSILVKGTVNSQVGRISEFFPELERQNLVVEASEFRLDFFFCSAPHRLRASVSAESVVFFHGRPLQLKERALLLGAMMDLQELLPPERVGAGLKRLDTKTFYPSLRSYEEEIRWHFYRLGK